MKLENLKNEIPYKWKVQTCKEKMCTCVAYIDARQLFDCLDAVCGPENWQSTFKEIQGRLYAGIGIKCGAEWVWKWDIGTEGDIEKEKAQASDALKRAGVHWGIGRFLYDLEIKKIWDVKQFGTNKAGKPVYAPTDQNGNRLYDVDKYIKDNEQQKPRPKAAPPKAPAPVTKDTDSLDVPPAKKELTEKQRKAIFAIVGKVMGELYDFKFNEDAADFIHFYFKVERSSDITFNNASRFISNHDPEKMRSSWGEYLNRNTEKAQEQGE